MKSRKGTQKAMLTSRKYKEFNVDLFGFLSTAWSRVSAQTFKSLFSVPSSSKLPSLYFHHSLTFYTVPITSRGIVIFFQLWNWWNERKGSEGKGVHLNIWSHWQFQLILEVRPTSFAQNQCLIEMEWKDPLIVEVQNFSHIWKKEIPAWGVLKKSIFQLLLIWEIELMELWATFGWSDTGRKDLGPQFLPTFVVCLY